MPNRRQGDHGGLEGRLQPPETSQLSRFSDPGRVRRRVCGIRLGQGLGSCRTRGCLPWSDSTLNPHIAWYKKPKPVRPTAPATPISRVSSQATNGNIPTPPFSKLSVCRGHGIRSTGLSRSRWGALIAAREPVSTFFPRAAQGSLQRLHICLCSVKLKTNTSLAKKLSPVLFGLLLHLAVFAIPNHLNARAISRHS